MFREWTTQGGPTGRPRGTCVERGLALIPILALIVLLGGAFEALAQGVGRAGTSSAQFLKLGVGARYAALGDAAAAFDGDPASLYWNPAGAAGVSGKSFAIAHSRLFFGLSHNFVGGILNLAGDHAVGLSATYLTTDDIEITTVAKPEGTGKYFAARSVALGATYAQAITDRLKLGVTVKYLLETIYHEHAQTVAADLGALVDTGILNSQFGVVLANLGHPMRMTGDDLKFREPGPAGRPVESMTGTEHWPLPVMFRLALRTHLVGPGGTFDLGAPHRMTLAAALNDPNDARIHLSLGTEYQWGDLLALRGGYLINYDQGQASLGVGVRRVLPDLTLHVDYAWVDYGELGTVNQVSLVFDFD